MTYQLRQRIAFAVFALSMLLAELWIDIGWKWFVVIAVFGIDLLLCAVLGVAPFTDTEDEQWTT